MHHHPPEAWPDILQSPLPRSSWRKSEPSASWTLARTTMLDRWWTSLSPCSTPSTSLSTNGWREFSKRTDGYGTIQPRAPYWRVLDNHFSPSVHVWLDLFSDTTVNGYGTIQPRAPYWRTLDNYCNPSVRDWRWLDLFLETIVNGYGESIVRSAFYFFKPFGERRDRFISQRWQTVDERWSFEVFIYIYILCKPFGWQLARTFHRRQTVKKEVKTCFILFGVSCDH